MHYTGIGSRETPKDVCHTFENIAIILEGKGWMLRSGGADGADTAFESGTETHEIWIPWHGFNNKRYGITPEIPGNVQDAIEIARNIHPAWERLKEGAKKLHVRNVYQVLGFTLDKPSRFLICWTKDGKMIGGTRTAISLAIKWGVPVYNFGDDVILKTYQKIGLKLFGLEDDIKPGFNF